MSAKLLNLEPGRRDAILNAALKEFVLEGYDKASTNVIAKEAGISKALMFHYVSSKQELFFWVYDYFDDLMKREYFERMDYEEKDIFNRLRQSYTLQIGLLEKYPWITEFHKLSQITRSEEINKEISNREQNPDCYSKLFEGVDTARFRDGLDIEVCKQFILWANVGFTNQLLEEIRSSEADSVDSNDIHKKLDRYFNELRNVFYTTNDE